MEGGDRSSRCWLQHRLFRTKCRGTTPRGAQQLLQAGAWPQLPAPRAPEAGVRAGGEALPFAAARAEKGAWRRAQ